MNSNPKIPGKCLRFAPSQHERGSVFRQEEMSGIDEIPLYSQPPVLAALQWLLPYRADFRDWGRK
jgi:hypothetical protein